MCTSARPARCRSTMWRAMCSASCSTRNASLITTSSIASSKSSGKRDMWTPFCAGSRSTEQSISAAISFSAPPQRNRIALLIPRTPARDRPIRTSGADACRSSSSSRDSLVRMAELEAPNDRYVEMIATAASQLAELLDELGLAARIEGNRYEPNLQSVNTLDLARGIATELGDERVRVGGEGGDVRVDLDATQRGLASLAQCALRHGGLEQVDVHATDEALTIAPVTPASGPVLLGEDLRD